MENDYFLLVDSVLQVGDVGRFVFVLEYLASENLLSHIVVHCARFGVEAYVGRAVEFYDFVWVRGDVDGHYLVVVEGLDTKVREGVDAEMVLGFVLYISLIGVDRLHVKVAHVVAETCDIALVVDTEIERTPGSRVEECTDAFQYVETLGCLVGLHAIVGRVDH